ncbi:MAG: hypothetical protein PUC79_08265 [Prevotellaceae bacterium]|nr:hypothetical protein [Prevotellaceae bacterium]
MEVSLRYVFATTFLVEYGCVLSQVHLTLELFSPSLHPHYRNFIATMASADFSQFVVTTANETACETSRDKSSVFPRLPA